MFIFLLELLQQKDNSYHLFSFSVLSLRATLNGNLFPLQKLARDPSPITVICCLTVVKASHTNQAFSPTVYVQIVEFYYIPVNQIIFKARETHRLVKLDLRSTTPTARSLGLSHGEANCLSLSSHSSELCYKVDQGVGSNPHRSWRQIT